MKTKTSLLIIVITALFLAMTGCENMMPSDSAEPDLGAPPPPLGIYRDFDDIKVPSDLSVNRKSSFVYQAQDLRVGVLSIYGHSAVPDVLAYIKENMKIDGWAQVSSFKYQKDILIYTKKNKICLILAEQTSRPDDAELEIWVAPLKSGVSLGQDSQETPAPVMSAPLGTSEEGLESGSGQGSSGPVNLFPFGSSGSQQEEPLEENIKEPQ